MEPGLYAETLDASSGPGWGGLAAGSPNAPREFLGVQYYDRDDGANGIRAVVVPLWAACALFAALPAVRTPGIIRRGRMKRRARGQCGHCGYNLTGNASGICPEC